MIEERTASEVADQAAEAVRTLNYLTLPADGAPGLGNPADVSYVISSLVIMAERLPQLLGQLSGWLLGQHDAGRIGHDTGLPAGYFVERASHDLGFASEAAGKLSRYLNDAHSACSGLTGTDSSEKEGQR